MTTVGGCSFGALDGFSSGGPPADGGATTDVVVTDAGAADADAAVVARSCKELKANTPAAPSGYFTIDPDGSGPAAILEVYCDMTTDGGGWTLVARSVPNGDGPLGWVASRGAARDVAAPYSLDVIGGGLEFDQVLVGAHASNNTFAGSAYRMEVPRTLLAANTGRAFESRGIVSVVGSCSPSGGPTMLRWVGFSGREEHIHLRDNEFLRDDQGSMYGLFADGFRLTYDDCGRGGRLNGEQGLIFVR